MKRTIAYVGLLLVLVLAGCGGGSSSAIPTRKATQIETIFSASGRGNEMGEDFTVPADCPRQSLRYRGELISGSGGFINFRVYDTAGNPADSAVGPVDLDEEQEGRALWSLGPGAYAVEVTADNADWSYRVQCR